MAGMPRAGVQTRTEEVASHTGQDTERFRSSRMIPAIPGGIESFVQAGTVLDENI
jgi:hypothetical protein